MTIAEYLTVFFFVVLPAITRLQKLSNHLSLLIPKVKKEDGNKTKSDLKFAKLAFGEDVNTIKEFMKYDWIGVWLADYLY